MPRKQVIRTARLVWFVDGEPDYDGIGPNREAADALVAHLRSAGSVGDGGDDALVMGFVTLASAIDSDPTNAALWSQYRAAEQAMRTKKAAAPKEGSVVLGLVGKFTPGGDSKPAASGGGGRRSQPRRSVGGHRTG